jgi:hypothetical protein
LIVTEELVWVDTDVGESDVIVGVGGAAHAAVVVAATVTDRVARPIEAALSARPVRLLSKFRNMFLLCIGDWLRGKREFCPSPS